MGFEVRSVTEDEWPAFVRTDNAAFGTQPDDDELTAERRGWDIERSVAAFDGGRLVGTAGSWSFELTLPGLTSAPAAGVTWVGVLPTHRRRGVLTQMMRHQLHDLHRRGESLAVLLASEWPIYGRFGYGMASSSASYTIERAHAGLVAPAADAGRVVLIDAAAASKLLPEVHERARRLHPGDIGRPPAYWTGWFRRDRPVPGASARFHVLHESAAGSVDGYASYRVRRQPWERMPGSASVVVDALTTTTPEAYAALWRFVSDIDLTATVEAWNRPTDEPLRWMLADPRRLEGKVADFLWVRLVDLPAALAARRYPVAGRLVIEVADPFCPWNDGRWELEGGPGGATAAPTRASADLSLTASDLAAAYLGDTRLSTLARAGRVDELTPGALVRADLMLWSEPRPWCQTFF